MKKILKKLFTVLPIILVSATICSNIPEEMINRSYSSKTNVRQMSNDLNSDNSEPLGKEDKYLEPVYGEYTMGSSRLRINEDTPDQYESNNSFSKATKLTSKPSSYPTNYSFSIYATLHIDPWWDIFSRDIDEDYYRFDIFANANVTMELKNIPVDRDYDMELYMHDNNGMASSHGISRLHYFYATKNNNENYTLYLTPGTYYLRVYSHEGHSAWDEYKLSASINYITDSYGSTSISNLRYNKGAGAAIWISDYDPYGIKPFTTYENVKVGQSFYDRFGNVNSAFPYNSNPFFSNIPKNTHIPHAILYVWDLDIRTELYETLSSWETQIEEKIEDNSNIRAERDAWETGISAGITLASIVLSVITLQPAFSLVASVGLDGISLVAAVILRVVFPDAWDTTKEGLLSHVRILKAALECDNDSTSSDEVVRIPVTYKLTTSLEQTSMINMTYLKTDYCDFTPQNIEGYLYDFSTISNNQGGIFGGQVYGIKKYSDFEAAFDRSTAFLEDVNTGGNTKIILENGGNAYLNKGEYHWYNFTAPVRAEYNFYSEGYTDTYGELFDSIVPGSSTNGRLDYDDDDGYGTNFSLSRILNIGETIYLRVKGYSSNTNGSYHVKVSQGEIYHGTNQTIDKTDYGFDGVYYFDPKEKDITLDNGFTFQTIRLRTGYVYDNMITQNSYLTLSAKRKNAGIAYLEYYFEDRVFEIDFDIGLWSANESLNSTNSTIKLEYLADGNWETGINFNVDSLPKSKDNLQHFNYVFKTQITGFRFIVSTNSVTSNSNKGRVVIGDINVKY